ncbi:MAG: O-antigen ligase family protein [Dehalococcoidia bacterium]
MSDLGPGGLVLLASVLVVVGVLGLIATWRIARDPFVGCALIVIGVPLTGGLRTAGIIPVLRVSELLTLLVAGALLLARMLDRTHYPLRPLDVPIAAFVLGIVTIPAFVLWGSGVTPEIDVLRRVLGPLQYLAVYAIFSRSLLDARQQRRLLDLAMAVSIVIAVFGILQMANFPGVRTFIDTAYPPTADICAFGSCRPTSLLEHWSAFGAFALMNYTLALALASTPAVGIPRRWLALVATVNAVAVFASQTQATVIGLALATAVVAVHRRRVPGVAVVSGAAILAGLALLWPEVSGRFEQQLFYAGNLATPESLLTRSRYWGEFFIPAILEHPWTGTGTVIPIDVPQRFIRFVDSEYLGMLFRAGAAGVVLLVVAMASMARAGIRGRAHPSPLVRALGAVLLADVVVLAAMGLTAEYLTFRGVSQTFWMTAGLFALVTMPASALAHAPRTDQSTVLAESVAPA